MHWLVVLVVGAGSVQRRRYVEGDLVVRGIVLDLSVLLGGIELCSASGDGPPLKLGRER